VEGVSQRRKQTKRFFPTEAPCSFLQGASKNLMEFWEGNNQKIKKGRHFGISSSEEMPSFPLRG